jgi:hypothetical protein
MSEKEGILRMQSSGRWAVCRPGRDPARLPRRLPVGENKRLHAAAHVLVENQVAMSDATVVPATLNRLMREGLDRHEAIHAIASVLMGVVFDTFRNPEGEQIDINAAYGRELGELTAASWRSQ